jgi:DNA mismatch repair protein MutL
MSKIKVLPVLLRNKIAAGEVIERPASVVKELIENSIDAGSTRIEVSIVGAGKRLIRVSDNGIGMDRQDALLSFERYSTSKIDNEEDLYHIRSMGFRGEALSSIAAVSKVKLVTAPREDNSGAGQAGLCIEIAGGELRGEKDCPASGTTIEIKDLFFNTPARRKFLKTDTTENYHIIDTVSREALSHHEIGFILRVDGEEVMALSPAASLKERITQLYGKGFADGMIEAFAEDGDYSLQAFMGKASNLRSNRNSQFLFINRRPVKDQSVNHAIYKAYEDMIPRDKHPVFFIFLVMDPGRVDVNVHPAKREVRFEDKTGIYNFIFRTARKSLKGSDMDFLSSTPEGETIGGIYSVGIQSGSVSRGIGTGEHVFQSGHRDVAEDAVSEASGLAYEIGPPFIYIGETFVALPGNDGITILDYHAAHERVNYERLLKKKDIGSHRLLFPQQAKLGPKEYRIILKSLSLLNDFGIEAEDFGHGTILVRSVPEMLMDADVAGFLSDTAACLGEEGAETGGSAGPMNESRKNLAARLACHSSIRGREVPDRARISQLLKSLSDCDEPDRCPHGRPTRIRITGTELKKMFRK